MEQIDRNIDDPEDWYRDTDTEQEIPDPNQDPQSLYQTSNKLPELLEKKHFVEGILYSFTLQKEKSVTFLGLLIECKRSSFIFRIYHTLGASRKIFHEGADDKEWDIDEVWRLAPRTELMLRREPEVVRVGQTVRFYYGGEYFTIRVTKTLSKQTEGVIMCGQQRGTTKRFELIEMLSIEEIFFFDMLQELYSSMMEAKITLGQKHFLAPFLL